LGRRRNLRRAHEAQHPSAARLVQSLYEQAIDQGAHPNQESVLSAVHRAGILTQSAVVYHDEESLRRTLQVVVKAAVAALGVFRSAFPIRFELMGDDRELAELATAFGVN
jgi:hypothetical protein